MDSFIEVLLYDKSSSSCSNSKSESKGTQIIYNNSGNNTALIDDRVRDVCLSSKKAVIFISFINV
jgi:hypothetical protein